MVFKIISWEEILILVEVVGLEFSSMRGFFIKLMKRLAVKI